ncbi:MAG: toll/interleukin-1 receptor domain-containing protein [Rhizomicrobium sp.]
MADIFISYAREDREWVEKLANAFVGEGYSVWWDFDLLVGKRYRESIETELANAKAAVVVWSQHSVHSDFVRDEAEEAQQRNILVPILKEAVRPPAGFRQLQTAELSTWSGGDLTHSEYRRMMRGVSHLVGRPANSADSHVDTAPAPPATTEIVAPPAPVIEAKVPEVKPVIRTAPPSPPPPPQPERRAVPMWAYIVGGVVGAVVLLTIIVALLGSPGPKPSTTSTAGPAVATPATPVTAQPQTMAPAAAPAAAPSVPATPPAGDSGADEAGNNPHHGSAAPAAAPTPPPPAPSGDDDSGGDVGQTRGH